MPAPRQEDGPDGQPPERGVGGCPKGTLRFILHDCELTAAELHDLLRREAHP